MKKKKKNQPAKNRAIGILLLGIYPEKTTIGKDTCTPVFTAALFTIAKAWKQPKCPLIEEWIKKMYIYVQWNTTRP